MRQPDHPRVSGEHSGLLVQLVPDEGSSPRERGARERVQVGTKRVRIIPA